MLAIELEQLLNKEIPITKALMVKVEQLCLDKILISAPISANKNVHNTAFAGSIFTCATLAGWSLVSNFVIESAIKATVVMAEASIKYKKPINGDIQASCQLPDEDVVTNFLERLEQKGRARMELKVDLIEDEVAKAQLTGQFAVILKS